MSILVIPAPDSTPSDATEEGLSVVADVGVRGFARYAVSLHPSSYTRLAYANQPKTILVSVHCRLIIDTQFLMDCLGFLPQGPGFDSKPVHVVFVSETHR